MDGSQALLPCHGGIENKALVILNGSKLRRGLKDVYFYLNFFSNTAIFRLHILLITAVPVFLSKQFTFMQFALEGPGGISSYLCACDSLLTAEAGPGSLFTLANLFILSPTLTLLAPAARIGPVPFSE